MFVGWSADLNLKRIPGEPEPLMVQHLAKYEKLFPALALIFHLVDCADDALARDRPVTVESAMRAAAWCEYLEAHARRCYGLIQDGGARGALTLAGKLEHGALVNGFTVRDVRLKQWSGLTTNDAIQTVLDHLEDKGWIRGNKAAHGEAGGRPTWRYQINPAVKAKPSEGFDSFDSNPT